MSKNSIKIIFFFICFLSIFYPFNVNSEEIKSFFSEIHVNRDSTIFVREDIQYDFQYAHRHGIFRDIPYKYDYGYKQYGIKIDVEDVTDSEGQSYNYSVSRSGNRVNIKIGDPDKTITGTHDYRIDYSVRGAIAFFEDHDELYWNVTGTEWRVPIKKAGAKVYLEGETIDGVKAKCFTGAAGSQARDCDYSMTHGTVEFTVSDALRAGQGLTIVIWLPKGTIEEPSSSTKAAWFLSDNWYFGLPFLTLILFTYIWHTRGRDPEGRGVIAVRYEPPEEITPAEAGTLVDESINILDITSTIIDLAVRGYLKIEETESTKFFFFNDRDYKLVKIKEPGAHELKQHEEKVFSGIFKGGDDIMVSDLRNKFYKELPPIKKALYKELIDKNYFPANPEKIKSIYKWVGIIIIILSFFLFSSLLLKISLALSGLIILIFSRFMPRKTKRGALVNEELLGFREFIERAEKDRIEKLAKDDPTLFDRVLPFALVFGLEDRWADSFKDMYREPPSWYSSPHYTGGFTPRIFVSDIGRSLSVMNSTLSSTPKRSGSSGFSGGGSSGGGFGGGGGGSW